jgi:hypothetical protein|eukprot:1056500-Prymnesium_polylepis.1
MTNHTHNVTIARSRGQDTGDMQLGFSKMALDPMAWWTTGGKNVELINLDNDGKYIRTTVNLILQGDAAKRRHELAASQLATRLITILNDLPTTIACAIMKEINLAPIALPTPTGTPKKRKPTTTSSPVEVVHKRPCGRAPNGANGAPMKWDTTNGIWV